MKITLKDIMESLNGDNVEDAQAALHEWFVDQGRTIQARLSGEQVAEADPVPTAQTQAFRIVVRDLANNVSDEEDPEDAADFHQFFYQEFSKVFHAASAEEAQAQAQAEMDDCMEGESLVYEFDWDHGASGYTDDGQGEGLEIYHVEVNQAHESVAEGEEAEDDKEEVAEAEEAEDDKEEVTESEDEEEEKVEESVDDLIAELAESFKGLETVSDKLQNVEGAQVGEEGKVPVNTKSTLPSHKGKDRLGGDPVEIKGKGHTGHALEKAPKVADVKVKNTVQNGKEELKKVADKGNASALLNKRDGKENTQSPISGKGATGLKK